MEVLFSEYLISEKLLNHEQLLEAIIEQLQSIPSIPEILYENNLLSKDNLLKILLHQKYEGTEFLISAKALGFWSPSISQQVTKKLKNIHKPLGEVLIQKGFLNLESLTSAFTKYVEIQGNKKELKKEHNKFDETILKEYITCFEGSIYPNLQSHLDQLKKGDKSQENILHEIQMILAEFVAARAAADFLGATRSNVIANEIIIYIEHFIEPNTNINFIDIIDVIDMSSQILNSYCKCLKISNSESGVVPEIKNLITKFCEKIGKKELDNENISS